MRKNLSDKAMIPEKPFGIFYFTAGNRWSAAAAYKAYYYYYYGLIC
jgi:hypothetical protein